MSENHFFAEQELCNSRLNDRVVDKRRRMSEPAHWRKKPSHMRESVVFSRGGFVARVNVEQAADPLEPEVAGGSELLNDLSQAERRDLFLPKGEEVAGGVGKAGRASARIVQEHTAQGVLDASSERGCHTSRAHAAGPGAVIGSAARRRSKLPPQQVATPAAQPPPIGMGASKSRRGRRVDESRLSFCIDD